MKTKTLTSLLALFGGVTASHGSITLYSDTFTYPDGDLVGNGTWVSHSGTAGTLDVVGGAASVTQDAGSEDAHATFAPQTTGIITATFDIVVNAPVAMTGTDFEYFAHFMADGTFNFRSRMDVQTPNGAGDYTLGLATSSSTGEVALPIDFAFGEIVPVALTFDLDVGTSSLTVGGETINSTGVSLGETIDSFALRQSSSSSDETILVDNLVVTSSVPEPSSALLGGIALLGLLRRRR